MQTARMVQAVGLMLIVAIAASCAASKEYTSKLFAPRIRVAKDSQATAQLRFLELDNVEPGKENWVSTDIIMGRDTVSNTLALDKLSTVYPASQVVSGDSVSKTVPVKKESVAVVAKPAPVESEPVARNLKPGEVRVKKTREEK